MLFLLNLDGILQLHLRLGYNLICNILGRLAQLVERLPYTQNVGSSSLSAPTNLFHSDSLFPGIPKLLLYRPSKLVGFISITSEPTHV